MNPDSKPAPKTSGPPPKAASSADNQDVGKLLSLIGHAPFGICRTTREGRFVLANPAFAEMLGYESVEEILGLDIIEDVYADPSVRSGLVEQLERDDSFEIVTKLKKKAFGTVTVRAVGRPVRTREGELEGLEVFVEDITERQILEQRLRQSQKLETLGTLSGGIAHDFNNLLVPILGYADLVNRGIPPDDPARLTLERHLYESAERAKELVEQVLAFGRREEQNLRILHPEAPVAHALRLLEATLPASIRLKKKIQAAGIRILADSAQLQQVVMNLCTNGSHAMGRDGGVLEVSLGAVTLPEAFSLKHPGFHGSEAVRLAVRDGGSGMEPAIVERIFEPFFTTKGPGEGTGLGLSVVYGIVTAHGGVVEVTSTPGEGSTFEVFFPAAGGPEDLLEDGADPVQNGSEHILFVDDSEGSRATAMQLLEGLGYRVSLAGSADEALQIFRADPGGIHVVVTDYDMAETDGITLALEMMEIRPSLPVLLLTGTGRGRSGEAVKLGLRGVLTKPFKASELSGGIRMALGE